MLSRSLDLEHKNISSIFKDNINHVELLENYNGGCTLYVYLKNKQIRKYKFKSFKYTLEHIMNTRMFHSGMVLVYNKNKNVISHTII